MYYFKYLFIAPTTGTITFLEVNPTYIKLYNQSLRPKGGTKDPEPHWIHACVDPSPIVP